MEKIKNHIFLNFIIIIFGLTIYSCNSSNSTNNESSTSTTGTLSLSLIDASTTDYKAVYITVKEVKVSLATEDQDDDEWIVVASPEKTYNLLELINGVTETLGITDLQAGEYDQMRLVLGETQDTELNIIGRSHPFANYIIDIGDNVYELTVPGGYQEGFKIIDGFTITEDATTDLILDFNVIDSIVQAGSSGTWSLNPTVKVLDEDELSYVSGVITDNDTGAPLEGVLVSAQISGDSSETNLVSTSTVSDESGGYTLLLSPGTYTLVANLSGYKSGAADVTVESGNDLKQDFSLEQRIGEGTITGNIIIDNGEDNQFIKVSIRQKVLYGENETIVEVASVNVANGGQYTIDLPEGTYSMVAVFTVDGIEMTLESGESFVITDGTVIEFDVLFSNVAVPGEDDDGEKPEKVTICHKGRTITISKSALNAHLNHGDVEGSCDEADPDNDSETNNDENEEDANNGNGQNKITVCHKGREIRISETALQVHLNHGDTLGSCDDSENNSDGENDTDPDDETNDENTNGNGNGNSNGNNK